MSEIVTYQWCQRCDCFTQRETPCPKCDESDCFIELVDKDAYDQAIKERDKAVGLINHLEETMQELTFWDNSNDCNEVVQALEKIAKYQAEGSGE